MASEERVVEDDLVDRPADAGLADDDCAGPEHRGDVGVGEVDDRPDAGMAGALDQEHVAIDRQPFACADRMRAGRSSITSPLMNALVKPRGMCTGLIVGQRVGQAEESPA